MTSMTWILINGGQLPYIPKSINELKKCLKICKDKYETEFSGNVNIKNVKKISNTGVLRISVGAITHSAKYFNTSLLFR